MRTDHHQCERDRRRPGNARRPERHAVATAPARMSRANCARSAATCRTPRRERCGGRGPASGARACPRARSRSPHTRARTTRWRAPEPVTRRQRGRGVVTGGGPPDTSELERNVGGGRVEARDGQCAERDQRMVADLEPRHQMVDCVLVRRSATRRSPRGSRPARRAARPRPRGGDGVARAASSEVGRSISAVRSRCSGRTLTSPSTGMKLVSPFHRGTTCWWT